MATSDRFDGMVGRLFRAGGSERMNSALGQKIIEVIGLGGVLIHLLSVPTIPGDAFSLGVWVWFPMVISFALVAVALWIRVQDLEAVALRISLWCLGGGASLATLSFILLVYQANVGLPISSPLHYVTTHLMVGALGGALIGVHDGMRVKRTNELAEERNLSDALQDQISVLERSLKLIRGNLSSLSDQMEQAAAESQILEQKAEQLQQLGTARTYELDDVFDEDVLEPTVLELTKVVDEKIRALGESYSAVQFECSSPDALVVSTPPLTEFLIDELLSNAIGHSDAEHPRINVSMEAKPLAGSRLLVEIEVSDNGGRVGRIHETGGGHDANPSGTNGSLDIGDVQWLSDAIDGELEFGHAENGWNSVKVTLTSPSIDTDGGDGE